MQRVTKHLWNRFEPIAAIEASIFLAIWNECQASVLWIWLEWQIHARVRAKARGIKEPDSRYARRSPGMET
jgi:hypothetical protein